MANILKVVEEVLSKQDEKRKYMIVPKPVYYMPTPIPSDQWTKPIPVKGEIHFSLYGMEIPFKKITDQPSKILSVYAYVD